ncbi:hypothetical protein D3C87_2186420 [compost metagenome]
MQLAIGFVTVFDLAAQFVQRADQFTCRVVLVTAVDRVVSVLHQQLWRFAAQHVRQLVSRKR